MYTINFMIGRHSFNDENWEIVANLQDRPSFVYGATRAVRDER
jgi:hypothetical protein